MCLTCTLEIVTGLKTKDLPGGWTDEVVAAVEWPQVTHGMVVAAKLMLCLRDCTSATTGGPLHIFTDDDNVEDHWLPSMEANIDGWTPYDEDTPESDTVLVKAICHRIIELAKPMTEAERAVAISLAWGNLTADRDGNVRLRGR